MKRPFLRVVVLAICALVLPATGQAQLVQVGPGFVKAPFVRVYWCPDGSTRVRAPFVDVVSPGFRRVSWVPNNSSATPNDLSEMDWRELRASLHRLAANLDAELDR